MGEELPAISLLPRPLQVGRIFRRSQQMNGFHHAVVGVERHHHGPLGMAPGNQGLVRIGLDPIQHGLEALPGLRKADHLHGAAQ